MRERSVKRNSSVCRVGMRMLRSASPLAWCNASSLQPWQIGWAPQHFHASVFLCLSVSSRVSQGFADSFAFMIRSRWTEAAASCAITPAWLHDNGTHAADCRAGVASRASDSKLAMNLSSMTTPPAAAAAGPASATAPLTSLCARCCGCCCWPACWRGAETKACLVAAPAATCKQTCVTV